ncbi:ABC transporter permease [Azospirillum sp.]|uniref:ABC transporter permease n=1 Tax=Azospirillum sp. TaxID=34012 RepID=UPI002D434AC8|nr:ABC transporter permease [Azospirillum sp.]HYD66556.1 ABC transporter permease [Azospirillum sp.]
MPSVHDRLIQLAILVTIFGGWEIGTATGFLDTFFFPPPSEIGWRVVTWAVDPEFYGDVSITLLETVLGYLIGTLLGVAMGVALGLHARAARILDPFIKVLNSIPRVVLAPLFILWLGLGLWSKVALAVTLVFFITFFNALEGVREVSRILLNNARILGAGPGELLRHVYLPSAATWILSSLRTSVGFAVVGAIIGEYLGSSAGLGHLISQAEGTFDAVGVFAGIVVLAGFVLVLDKMLTVVEHRLIVWRPRAESGANP